MCCKASLDILNDLLCFDKLDCGILELHKQEVPILPLLVDAVAMFAGHAKENNITLSFINIGNEIDTNDSFGSVRCSPLLNLSTNLSTNTSSRNNNDILRSDTGGSNKLKKSRSLPLQDSEFALIDKFKIDQVVRNLLSNALKFTASGGEIAVKTYFMPCPHGKCESKKKPHPKVVKALYSAERSRSWMSRIPSFGPSHTSACGDIESLGEAQYVEQATLRAVEGYLVIEVTDNGAGISLCNQRKLFKEIVQFNPEILQAGGGSGLGLWITKSLVDLHDGDISVFSEGEGKGCKFSVRLPMLRRPTLCIEPLLSAKISPRAVVNGPSRSIRSFGRTSSRSSVSIMDASCSMNTTDMQSETNRLKCITLACSELRRTSDASSHYHMLVVDDSRLNRKMLCKVLNGAGHTCDIAEDGLEAVARVKGKMSSPRGILTYDAIFMDFVMPNMDGPTATKEIRSLGFTGHIIGVTGNALDSDVTYFIDAGATKVLTKPVNVDDLQKCMHLISKSFKGFNFDEYNSDDDDDKTIDKDNGNGNGNNCLQPSNGKYNSFRKIRKDSEDETRK